MLEALPLGVALFGVRHALALIGANKRLKTREKGKEMMRVPAISGCYVDAVSVSVSALR